MIKSGEMKRKAQEQPTTDRLQEAPATYGIAPKTGQAVARALKHLRTEFGLSLNLLVKLSGFSPRALANWEGGAKATAPAERKFIELQRLFEAIAGLTQDRKDVARWMQEPTPAFDGSTPAQVIERGETDRLWRMVYYMESGEPG